MVLRVVKRCIRLTAGRKSFSLPMPGLTFVLGLVIGMGVFSQPAVAAPDTSAPRGTFFTPVTDLSADSEIKIAVYDPQVTGKDLSEINLREVTMSVAGVDVTAKAKYTHEKNRNKLYGLGSAASGVTKSKFGVVRYQIEETNRYRNGQSILVVLQLVDGEGNKRKVTQRYRYNKRALRDNRKPTGRWLSPTGNKVIRDDRTTLRLSVSDGPSRNGRPTSELDLTSFRLVVGGRDVTGDAVYYHRNRTNRAYRMGPLAITTQLLSSSGGLIVYKPAPARPLPWGAVDVALYFADRDGNSGVVRRDLTVRDSDTPILSLPSARPSRGNAPLTVKFQPNFSVETAVKRVQWDFEGDGKYDVNEEVGTDRSFVFKEPGTYRTRLRLTDSRGRIAIGTVKVVVKNAAPDVKTSVSPSNGEVPLTVTFNAAATDYDGIRQYAWDFNGDGRYDYRSTTSGTTTYEFKRVGNYKPVLRVTDNRGLSTTVSLPTTEVKVVRKGSPSVELSASTSGGNAPVSVRFSARTSLPTGVTATKYSWDFNGDGKYDKDTDSPTSDYRYTAARTYFPRVRVTTSDRQRAIDTTEIRVGAAVKLTMSSDSIQPDEGESVEVQTSLSGTVNIGINIEDELGKIVRKLKQTRRRKAGTYRDLWDGRDDAGRIVKDGAYYAVAKYEVDGKTTRLDLRDSTGGRQSSPRRNQIDSSFSPFAGEPLTINFTLNKAAKVTAFMGLLNVNTRLLTFYQRQPIGAGEHTIVWNGENANGQLVHPPSRDRFLFGIFEFSLADNAVVVANTAEVSDVKATPAIFVPGPTSTSTLTFSLSKIADVEMLIIDAENGAEVGRRLYKKRRAGENTINWDGRVIVGRNTRSFVAPGRYRIGIRAVMPNGTRSIAVYTLQQVYF